MYAVFMHVYGNLLSSDTTVLIYLANKPTSLTIFIRIFY